MQINKRLPSKLPADLLSRITGLLRQGGKLGRSMPRLECDAPASARADAAIATLQRRGVLLLYGPGGMGKTAVANTVFTKCQVSPTFGGRCSVVALGNKPDEQHMRSLQSTIFQDLFDGHQPVQHDLNGRRAELLALLEDNGPYIIIVDDVWPVQSAHGRAGPEHPLWELLPRDSVMMKNQLQLLVVSEAHELADKLPVQCNAAVRRIRGLGRAEARQLFMHYARKTPKTGPPRIFMVEQLEQAADAAVKQLPRLTLALKLEGLAWACNVDPGPGPVAQAQHGMSVKQMYADRLGKSFRSLPSNEQEAFLTICTSKLAWPTGQPRSLLCGVFGDATIARLTERGFLAHRPGSFASQVIASPPPVLAALASEWCGGADRCWRLKNLSHAQIKLVRLWQAFWCRYTSSVMASACNV